MTHAISLLSNRRARIIILLALLFFETIMSSPVYGIPNSDNVYESPTSIPEVPNDSADQNIPDIIPDDYSESQTNTAVTTPQIQNGEKASNLSKEYSEYTLSPIDWYEGETVYTKQFLPYRYPSTIPNDPTISAETFEATPGTTTTTNMILNYTTIQGDLFDLVTDDTSYHAFESLDKIDASSSGSTDGTYSAYIFYYSSFTYQIPVSSTTGTISVVVVADGYWRYSVSGFVYGWGFELSMTGDILNTATGEFESTPITTNTTSPSGGQTERTISKTISYSDTNIVNNMLLARFNVNLRVFADAVADSSSGFPSAYASVSVSNLVLGVDMVKVEQDSIQEQTRSSYRYVSSTILEHSLILDSLDYGSTLWIYAPNSWNFSSINPKANVSYDAGGYWVVKNTYPASYSILFLSGDGYGVDYKRKPQLLAIEDVSSDYMKNPDFETGSYSEWVNSGFGTVALDTSIVFSGSFSLHLSDSDGSTDRFYTTLDDGYYYFAFSYYVVTAPTTLYFEYYENGMQYITLDTSVQNRWIQYFGYVHIAGKEGGSNANFGFRFSASSGDIYVDSIRIYKPSTVITTQGLNKYQISGQLISWDNRQNPSAQNKNVQIQLRSRTDGSMVREWRNTKTDNEGLFSIFFTQILEQKEYEIMVWSNDNWFGTPWTYNDQLNLSYWTSGYMATFFSSQVEDYVRFDWNATTSHSDLGYIYFNTPGTWDLSQVDVFAFETYSPTTVSYKSFDVVAAWYNNVTVSYFDSDPTSWEVFSLVYRAKDDPNDDFASRSQWDENSLKDVSHLLFELFDDGDEIIYFRNVHVVIGQKTFFTPIPTSQKSFQYLENNEWDYSEDNLDGYFTASGISSVVSGDGYLQLTTNYRTYGADFYFSSKTISDYYPYSRIVFRARYSTLVESDGIDVLVKFNTGTGSYPGLSQYYILSSQWQTFEFDLSGSSYWDRAAYPNGRLYLTFSCLANSTIHAGNIIEIDFVRLIHAKTAELYQADTYAFASSDENDSLSYLIYSDGNYAGTSRDLDMIGLNMTLGQHNLTLIPYFDSAETFPGIFLPNYGSKLQYTYEVTEDDLAIAAITYPDYDIATGFLTIYYETNWGNTSLQVFQNGTLLGSGNEATNLVFTFDNSYGVWNFTYLLNGGSQQLVITDWLSIIREIEYETVLIYTYDLSGQRIYDPVWDLYYNDSILETYAVTVPESTFDPTLVSFRDLFGTIYAAILINQTTSLQGYKVYQFQLQGHEIVLFNEASDKLANLAIYYSNTDSWVNYSLAPKEERRVWLANTTYSFYAFIADLDEFALAGQNMTLELVGNATKQVTESFKFGITANLRSLLGSEDITSQTFIEQNIQSEKQNYALYYQGAFLGIPVDIRISWSQLWYLIIVGIFTLAFAVFRVYVSKYTEEYIDERGKKRRRAKPGAEHVENVVKTMVFVSIVAVLGLIARTILY